MQDECKVYIDSYMASNGSYFMVTCIIFKKTLFGGRSNTIPGDHGILLIYSILSCVRIMHELKCIWLRARSQMTSLRITLNGM